MPNPRFFVSIDIYTSHGVPLVNVDENMETLQQVFDKIAAVATALAVAGSNIEDPVYKVKIEE